MNLISKAMEWMGEMTSRSNAEMVLVLMIGLLVGGLVIVVAANVPLVYVTEEDGTTKAYGVRGRCK